MAVESRNCCTHCLGFITTTGLTAVFMWLTLRTIQPKGSIEFLYLPSFNKTLSHNHNNNSIIFMLKLANENKDKGTRYDTVHLSFGIFVNANTTKPLANATVPAFYQGRGKTAKKWSSGEVHDGGGVKRELVEGRVFLRVEFATAVKYKILFWFTKRQRLWGGANVEMNVSSGEKVNPKGIRLGNVPARIESEAAEVREHSGAAILRFFCYCCSVTRCVYLS